MSELKHRNFGPLLNRRWETTNSLAATGIDPDVTKIPSEVWSQVGGRQNIRQGVEYFCQEIIKSTNEYICAYKIQPAFFTSLGAAGEEALKNVIDFAKKHYSDTPVIMDGKFSDISNTLDQYVQKVFDSLNADAVLVNPLMGSDSVLPFSSRAEKGIFILCKTSNPSSVEILDVKTDPCVLIWCETTSPQKLL